MKYKFLSAIGTLANAAAVGACTPSTPEYSKVKVPPSQIESNLEVFGITPGINALVL